MKHSAYLALGSNIDPEKNLHSAWSELGQTLFISRASSIWESPPVGAEGANFLNAVLQVETLFGLDLLKWQVLRGLETRLGRVRTEDKYAPRTIDLDILIYDGRVLDANLWNLAYLAAPCAELLPAMKHPQSSISLEECARELSVMQNTILRFHSFEELIQHPSL